MKKEEVLVKIFNQVFSHIKGNKIAKESGKLTSVSPPFPRLARRFPGWVRGKYNIITASSGVGKTKIAKFLTVTSVYNFAKANPLIKVKVKYYALEESIINFWLGIVSTMLLEKYGIELSVAQLTSLGEFTLSDDILAKVEECQSVVDDMEQYIEVNDHVSNPYGIYKDVRQFFENPEIGEYLYEIKTIDGKEEKVIIGYKYKDPDLWVFVVTDHISLLTAENGKTQYESIGHFSKEYCLKGFCKRFNCVVVNIQQQVAEKERLEFYQGQTIEQKMEPSLDGLANNKETQRDAHLVLGLFAPNRYGIRKHRGYDIDKLKDRYRSLIFLKDRDYGLNSVYVGLYFRGAANSFEELPISSEVNYTIYAPEQSLFTVDTNQL